MEEKISHLASPGLLMADETGIMMSVIAVMVVMKMLPLVTNYRSRSSL